MYLDIKRYIMVLINHDLRLVYIDLFLRLSLGFFIFTIITVKADSSIFSIYAFSILISSLVVQIVNGSTEVLINNQLVFNKNYLNFFLYKLILVKILFFPVFVVIDFSFYLLICFFISIFSIVNEHIDLKLRYKYDYVIYNYKVALQFLFFIIKYMAAIKSYILVVMLCSLIEAFFISLISFLYCRKYFDGENDRVIFFLKNEKESLLKYAISSFLIFLFFRLDQIYIFFKVNSYLFSSYFIASRFNEILNSMVGIWVRYSIPKLFIENDIYFFRKAIIENMIIHIIFSFILFVPVYIYTNYVNDFYSSIIYIYMILAASGFFLVFGQIRGVYFVKNKSLSPDIINAILGILTFLVSLWILEGFFEVFYIMPIAYLIGFMVSGFLTTFFYKLGRVFMSKIIFGGNNNG